MTSESEKIFLCFFFRFKLESTTYISLTSPTVRTGQANHRQWAMVANEKLKPHANGCTSICLKPRARSAYSGVMIVAHASGNCLRQIAVRLVPMLAVFLDNCLRQMKKQFHQKQNYILHFFLFL